MAVSPFSDLLKTLRLRVHLSQRVLAEKMGVHRNTIWSWEQGNYLPDSKGMVLELAHLLHLNELETRELLDASLTAPSLYWSVPYQRNAFFTGREALLDRLHQMLGADHAVALTQSYALHGLGGIGKTQIALEYAYRYALEYSAVFWIEAETAESILASLGRIAAQLQLPERGDPNQQRMVAALHRWLSTHGTWLFIWDNVEDPALLQRFLPLAPQGATLITARRPALGTLAHSLELSPMTLEEGTLFVLRRVQLLKEDLIRKSGSDDAQPLPPAWEAAQELVNVMGGLPLALDQAGAYIEETGCSIADYLQRYTQQRVQLLDRRGTSGRDHPHAVTTTFSLAYTQVRQQNPLAADLLCLCAFLNAEGIPENLFVADPHDAGQPIVADLYQLDQAIATLRTFALVQRHPETGTLSLHHLVQTVLQEEMSQQERVACQQRVVGLLNALFPEVTRETWSQCERLLPHVLLCETTLPDQLWEQDQVEMLRRAADYLGWRAQYELAASLYRRVFSLQEQRFGAEHTSMAAALDGLARVFMAQGKYEQAEVLHQRALHIWEQTVGQEHLQFARSLNSLAALSCSRANYLQAERLHQQALDILERIQGPEHPDLAHPFNDLANVYAEQGKHEQAERCYERALQIWENAYESEHHDLAYPLYNLADLYREQGKNEQAEHCYERALRIWEHELGSEHPLLAHPLDGLAAVWVQQGKEEQAERLYQRALRIREQALGPEHPGLATSLGGLADLSSQQGEDEQAEQLYQRALRIQKQALGPNHPDVALTLNGLASLYSKQKKYEQSKTLYEQALSLQEKQLGPEHPRTIATRNHLAALSQGFCFSGMLKRSGEDLERT